MEMSGESIRCFTLPLMGVVKTTYGLSAHFRVEIFPQILLLTLYVTLNVVKLSVIAPALP